MNIHMVNEHLDMQAKKLNAKYHLHVQHTTDARTLKQEALGLNCVKNANPTRVQEYYRKCKTLTKSTKLHKQGYI